MIENIAAILLIIGGLFLLVGSAGLARLPDFLTRLHGPTKATTLGIGLILAAVMMIFSSQQGYLSVHELMIVLFLFLTAPISAHMLAKVALHLDLPARENTQNKHLLISAKNRQPPPKEEP